MLTEKRLDEIRTIVTGLIRDGKLLSDAEKDLLVDFRDLLAHCYQQQERIAALEGTLKRFFKHHSTQDVQGVHPDWIEEARAALARATANSEEDIDNG